jgi:hypothetical protein
LHRVVLVAKSFLRPARSTTILLLLLSAWLLVAMLGLLPAILEGAGSSLPALRGEYLEIHSTACEDCSEDRLSNCKLVGQGIVINASTLRVKDSIYVYLPISKPTWSLAKDAELECQGRIIRAEWRVLGPGILYAHLSSGPSQDCSGRRVWVRIVEKRLVAEALIKALSKDLSASLGAAALSLSSLMAVAVAVAEAYNAAGTCQAYRVLRDIGASGKHATLLVSIGLFTHSLLALLLGFGLGEIVVHSVLWLVAELYGYILPSPPLLPSATLLAFATASSLLGAVAGAVTGRRLCREQQ